MSESSALQRLAAAAGIETSFQDNWGQEHRVSDETLRALLAAMGVATDFPGAIAEGLNRFEAEPWSRPMEPAWVLREDGRGSRLPIVLAAAANEGAHEWVLEREDGEVDSGTFRPGDLPLLDRGDPNGESLERRGLTVPASLPMGYHRLRLRGSGLGTRSEAQTTLIATPGQAYLPPNRLRGEDGVWGFAVQVFSLRSSSGWGIGDFSDLGRFVRGSAAAGADIVGLNPLHALFAGRLGRGGPYSPSSRTFLNYLYLAIEEIPDFAESGTAREIVGGAEFQRRLSMLNAKAIIDHADVAGCKLRVLSAMYDSFRSRHLGGGEGSTVTERGAAFRRFQEEGGRSLRRLAVFDALCEYQGGDRGWQDWPEALRSPDSPAVEDFAQSRPARVEFFEYLQWLADEQLAAVAQSCRKAGMALGLYGDLALGADREGADAWSQQDWIADGVSIGAPPDAFNLKGQNWGLPPFIPSALSRAAYAPFVTMLRANMRHFGALRLDHVMSLARQFWIPSGAEAGQGAYVRYPLEDLLGIVALESRRNRCVVIGEDLGTVPDGFRERLARASILSYRVLYFEKEADGGFKRPRDYPRQALAVAATHDLPTLPGFWQGHDLKIRSDLGLFPSWDIEKWIVNERAADRQALLAALAGEGLAIGADGEVSPADLVEAVYRYLSRTPSHIVAVQIEDVLGQLDQVNMPGTIYEHPNWCRRLPKTVEGLLADEGFVSLCQAMRGERPGDARKRGMDDA